MRGCLVKGDVRKIIIVKLRAVGDVVLATAVLPSLRKAFPAARIDFLVESAGREVVEGSPYVDRVVVLPRKEWEALPNVVGWVKGLRFVRMLRDEGYDLVFDLFGNPRSAFLTWAMGARCRVGFVFRGSKYAYHLNKTGVTKASGLSIALKYINVSPSDTVAIGDSETDIPMFELCGYSVAVANSPQEVKDKANYVAENGLGRGLIEAVQHLAEKFLQRSVG